MRHDEADTHRREAAEDSRAKADASAAVDVGAANDPVPVNDPVGRERSADGPDPASAPSA
jgi:hypothetical protein